MRLQPRTLTGFRQHVTKVLLGNVKGLLRQHHGKAVPILAITVLWGVRAMGHVGTIKDCTHAIVDCIPLGAQVEVWAGLDR